MSREEERSSTRNGIDLFVGAAERKTAMWLSEVFHDRN